MKILAFDTCFDACSVCVAQHGDDDVTELAGVSERFATGHAETLIPFVDESMRRAGVAFADIDRIAVTIGPGTFTGTRIGAAAARGLALATQIEIVSTTSLAVMAEVAAGELRRSRLESDLAIAVDARRNQAYVQLFGMGGLDPKSPPMLLSIDEASRLGGDGPLLIAGSGAEMVAAVAAQRGRQAVSHFAELLPEATALARMAIALPVIEGALVPLYLRPPDAKPQDGKSIARAEP
jgi:tRNA threonylcarbamoyladenosine biosynthesis protein TsaB